MPSHLSFSKLAGPFIAIQTYVRKEISEEQLLEAKSFGYELVYEDDKPEKKSNPLLPF